MIINVTTLANEFEAAYARTDSPRMTPGSMEVTPDPDEPWVMILRAHYEDEAPGVWVDTRVRVHEDGKSWLVVSIDSR